MRVREVSNETPKVVADLFRVLSRNPPEPPPPPDAEDRRLRRLGVPAKAREVLLGQMHETEALAAARRFVATPARERPLLALLGDVGLGKTVAAAWVFRELVRGVPEWRSTGETDVPVWMRGPDFTRVSAYSPEDSRMIREAQRAPLLVVDELGDEATPLGTATVRDICMAREANNRRTVLTSNLRPSDFARLYGRALYDRLVSRGIVTGLTGPSMRRQR